MEMLVGAGPSARVQESTFFMQLPAPLRALWEPLLTPVQVEAGGHVYDSLDPVKYVFFPIDCVVAVTMSAPSGASAMMALVGHEGFIGMPAAMSGTFLQAKGVVLLGGRALRLESHHLTAAFASNAEFRQLLMNYIQVFIIHTGQLALCNRHCTVDGQLATILLRAMDRRRSMDLGMTHERLGNVLGWRRETVTQSTQRLQAAGALSARRGHLWVYSRPALERLACTCYAALQESYKEIWIAPHWP
jgi:CRP-like cAMP-binding protein